jgi:hypothetical protein
MLPLSVFPFILLSVTFNNISQRILIYKIAYQNTISNKYSTLIGGCWHMSTKIILESSIAYSGVQHDLMSNIKGVLKDSKTVYPSRAPGFTPDFLLMSVLLIFLVFCIVLCYFSFVYLFLCLVCPKSLDCLFLIAPFSFL